jgi:hypothetical protein
VCLLLLLINQVTLAGASTREMNSKLPRDLEVMIDGQSIYDPLLSGLKWRSTGITVHDILTVEITLNF